MEAFSEWRWFFALVVLAILFYRYCGLTLGWVKNLKFAQGTVHILFSIFFLCFATWSAHIANELRIHNEALPYLSPLGWSILLAVVLLVGTSFCIAKGLLFGCVMVAFGGIANISAVLLNDGQMPVKIFSFESIVIADDITGEPIEEVAGGQWELEQAIKAAKENNKNIRVSFERSPIHTIMIPESKLKELCDIIFVQFADVSVVLSFGDLLLFLGIFMFLTEVFTRKEDMLTLKADQSLLENEPLEKKE